MTGLIGTGPVQQHAVMKRTASTLQLDLHFARPVNLIVANLHVDTVTDHPRLVMIQQWPSMTAGYECQATVFDRGR